MAYHTTMTNVVVDVIFHSHLTTCIPLRVFLPETRFSMKPLRLLEAL